MPHGTPAEKEKGCHDEIIRAFSNDKIEKDVVEIWFKNCSNNIFVKFPESSQTSCITRLAMMDASFIHQPCYYQTPLQFSAKPTRAMFLLLLDEYFR